MRVAVKWKYWRAAQGIPERKEHKVENNRVISLNTTARVLKYVASEAGLAAKQGKSYDSDCVAFLWPRFGIEKSDQSSLTEVIPVQHLRPSDCRSTDLLAPGHLLHLDVGATAGTGFLICSLSGGPLQLKGSVAMEQLVQNNTIIVTNLRGTSSCHGDDVVFCLYWLAHNLTSSLLCNTFCPQ